MCACFSEIGCQIKSSLDQLLISRNTLFGKLLYFKILQLHPILKAPTLCSVIVWCTFHKALTPVSIPYFVMSLLIQHPLERSELDKRWLMPSYELDTPKKSVRHSPSLLLPGRLRWGSPHPAQQWSVPLCLHPQGGQMWYPEVSQLSGSRHWLKWIPWINFWYKVCCRFSICSVFNILGTPSRWDMLLAKLDSIFLRERQIWSLHVISCELLYLPT